MNSDAVNRITTDLGDKLVEMAELVDIPTDDPQLDADFKRAYEKGEALLRLLAAGDRRGVHRRTPRTAGDAT